MLVEGRKAEPVPHHTPPHLHRALLPCRHKVVLLRVVDAFQVSADELDDVKYKCNLSESLATTISKNLGIKLNDYVLYA